MLGNLYYYLTRPSDRRKRELVKERARLLRGRNYVTEKEMRGIFDTINKEGDGFITDLELERFIRDSHTIKEEVSDAKIHQLIDEADLNRDGTVDYEEFLKAVHYVRNNALLSKLTCGLVTPKGHVRPPGTEDARITARTTTSHLEPKFGCPAVRIPRSSKIPRRMHPANMYGAEDDAFTWSKLLRLGFFTTEDEEQLWAIQLARGSGRNRGQATPSPGRVHSAL